MDLIHPQLNFQALSNKQKSVKIEYGELEVCVASAYPLRTNGSYIQEESAKVASNMNLTWVLARQINPGSQNITSKTGFNIITRDQE